MPIKSLYSDWSVWIKVNIPFYMYLQMIAWLTKLNIVIVYYYVTRHFTVKFGINLHCSNWAVINSENFRRGSIRSFLQSNKLSFAVRLRCQETELGQTFGTSVVTNYIHPACMAWEEGYDKVGSLALMWQKGIFIKFCPPYVWCMRF